MGAGRGPLILCTLAAAQRTKRSVVVYAIEKNPNAIVTLQSLHASLQWGDRVHIVETDMRVYRPVFYSDVILSELLGSFGDNELSPECLIGTERYLIEGGVFLPRDCTSYLACCMSSRIWNNVSVRVCRHGQAKKVDALFTPAPLESTYVVQIHNAAVLTEIEPVFTFTHPDQKHGDFRCFKVGLIMGDHPQEVSFKAVSDGVVHGFAGYFESNVGVERC